MGNKGAKPVSKKSPSKNADASKGGDEPDAVAEVINAGEAQSPEILPHDVTAGSPEPKAADGGAAGGPASPLSSDDAFNIDGRPSSKLTTKVCKEDFIHLKVVGKGSFGKVLQVQKIDNGKIYAMKILKKAQLVARKQVAHTKTERKVLEDIDHPFIVSLRYAFQTEDKLYMILDYFSGGELFFHLKNSGRFPEERAKFYAAEITLALECLHEHNIVYRDLKPENVLLDEDGHIRLTDFGLSKDAVGSGQLTHTFCGTPEYLAPEVIHGAGYGQAVDWWSLGTLLYEMLTGLPPFYSNNLHVMYEKIISAKLEFPAYFTQPTKAILKAFLERDPRDRIGSDGDGKEIKQHPFFRDIDWVKLYNKEIEPPFRPHNEGGKLNTANVDEEFLSEQPRDTPTQPSQIPVEFNDFSFTGKDSNILPAGDELAGLSPEPESSPPQPPQGTSFDEYGSPASPDEATLQKQLADGTVCVSIE